MISYLLPLINKFSKLIQNNSIIIIPPIGETVALTGGFLNNGIYELSNKQNKLKDLVKIAGNYKKPVNLN